MTQFIDFFYTAGPTEVSKWGFPSRNDTITEEEEVYGGRSGGAVYTIWGSENCPSASGTKMVYSGMAGKTFYNQKGGGVDFQCLPAEPQFYDDYRPGVQGYAYMYGVEYEAPVKGSHNHNMPCAVCYTLARSMKLMIPALKDCPNGWTKEYAGFLMSGYHDHIGSTTFVCVDYIQESLPGSSDNSDGGLVYHVEPICNLPGFPCPPYDAQKELTCVVCTM